MAGGAARARSACCSRSRRTSSASRALDWASDAASAAAGARAPARVPARARGRRRRGRAAEEGATSCVALVASPPDDVEPLYWRARVTLLGERRGLRALRRGLRGVLPRRAAARATRSRPTPPEERGRDRRAAGRGRGARSTRSTRAPGSGLHASPADLANARTFAPRDAGGARRARRAARGARRRRPPAGRGAALRAGAARPAARPAARARTPPTARAARSSSSRGASGRARPRRVLVLIDVSGSLRAHSPDLLRFAHVLVRATDRAEAFTFGTRLTRVTRELDAPDVDAALDGLSACVLDADGGTRIGVALSQFLANGRYVALARGALVIVLSDGLERGDPARWPRPCQAARAARPPARVVVAAGLRSGLPAGDARDEGGARRPRRPGRSARPP